LVNGLLTIQAFLILIGGSNAIHRAQARDYETKMLESHRLTPMSNIGVALGYLIGPNLQILMLYAVSLSIGMGICGIGNLPLGDWVVGNLLLLVAAIMVWSAVVFSGMRPAKPVSPAWVLIAMTGLFLPLSFLPGAGMFLGIYPVILSIWIGVSRIPATDPAYILIAATTVLLTIFWLSAAAAKYRRPDLPAFNAIRGMTLLILWLFISVGGLVAYVALSKSTFPWLRDLEVIPIQWVGTLLATLPIATLVTIGAAECHNAVSRGRQPRGWSDRVSDVTVAVIAPLLICGISASLGLSIWFEFAPHAATQGDAPRWAFQSWSLTIAAFFLTLITARGIYRIVTLRFPFKSPLTITWSALVAFWILPPGIEVIRVQAVAGFDNEYSFSSLLSAAPPVSSLLSGRTFPPP
jgi:hypothetical protein